MPLIVRGAAVGSASTWTGRPAHPLGVTPRPFRPQMLRGGQTVTVNPGIGKVSASSGQMSVLSAMKYIPLIWSGIWRRPGRSVLMLLQIASAFTLFGVLQGLSSGEKLAIASTHSNRLYVMSRVSTGDLM